MENDYVLNIVKINECRICLEEVKKYKKHCSCSGTVGFIHRNCLIRYINENENKIENYNCYQSRIQCDICKSYIYFYYRKKYIFYILVFCYSGFYLIFTILYFIFLTKYLFKLLYILLYMLITILYLLSVIYNIKTKKLYKSYICF